MHLWTQTQQPKKLCFAEFIFVRIATQSTGNYGNIPKMTVTGIKINSDNSINLSKTIPKLILIHLKGFHLSMSIGTRQSGKINSENQFQKKTMWLSVFMTT